MTELTNNSYVLSLASHVPNLFKLSIQRKG